MSLILWGILLFFPLRTCLADDEPISGPFEINTTTLRNQGVYTELIKSFVESGDRRSSRGLTFEGFLNIFSFYQGREDTDSTLDINVTFLEELTENFIKDLDRNIVFVSQMEIESMITEQENFPYGQQVWHGLADTMTRRYTLARWVDDAARKIQSVTSVSYTSTETGIKLRLGPYFGDPPGIYASAKKEHLRIMCLGNGDMTRVGLEWIFDGGDIGNKLGYIETSKDGKNITISVLYKERF